MCQVRCYNHSGEKFLRINALTWPLWFSEYYTEFLIECTYELYGGAIKISLSDGSITFNSFLLWRLWEFRNPNPNSNPARYYLEFRLNEDSVFRLSVFLNSVCLFFFFLQSVPHVSLAGITSHKPKCNIPHWKYTWRGYFQTSQNPKQTF